MTRAITTYTVAGTPVLCWCDIAQVSLMTGKTPAPEVMVQAQMVIESYTECFADAQPPTMWPRDLRWLQDALAYQAAWMTGRLDNFDNVDVVSVSQDGQSATMAHGQANKLAPFAWTSILKLSWMRTGKIRMQPDRTARYANWQQIQDAFLRDEAPGDAPWQTAGPGGLA
jgi:hypothetical protein